MAEIELVIKIPEGLKNDFVFEHWTALSCMAMKTALERAIQLPKRHGRLIDADAFIKQESCCGYIEDMDIDYFKQNTPTIIDADKEGE